MESLSLHILDVAENSVRAGAKRIEINIVEDEENDALTVSIKDDGCGMESAKATASLDPFFTTKDGKGVGLGLSLLAQASRATGGDTTIRSEKGRGTEITAVFGYGHPDRQPIGSMAESIAAVVVGHPEIRMIYNHQHGPNTYHFDSHAEDKTEA